MSEPHAARFQALDAEGKKLLFSIGCDVIDYIEPARTFGREDLADAERKGRFQPRLVAIPDRRDRAVEPIILSLGNQSRLSLVRRLDPGAAESAGWEQIDLSLGLDKLARGAVTAFGAAWAKEGLEDKITIAVALQVADCKGSRIFIAYDINSRTADWHDIRWVDYGCREGLDVDAIRVMPDVQGIWTTLLSAGATRTQNTYLVRSNRPRTLAEGLIVFSVATDLKEILDFQIGGCDGDGALHVLGAATHLGERTLFARPFPAFDSDDDPDITNVYPFRCPEDASVLALGANRGRDGADLYIGGKGVHCIAARQFARQEDALQTVVISMEAAEDVRRLVVTDSDDAGTTVWALLSDGRLITARRAPGTADWTQPLQLRQGVWDIAPVESDAGLTSSVLVVYERGLAAHLWRDATGIWQETEIRVADAEEASSITCFSTNLCLFDEGGVPRPATRVKIRASVPSYLVINGRSYRVGPSLSADVAANLQGSVTIFNRAMSFSPATYRIEVDGMTQCLDVNPAGALYKRFATLTEAELREAKIAGSGEPLLPESYRTGKESGAVTALTDAMRKAAELTGVNDEAVPGVRLVGAPAPFSSLLTSASLPDGYAWGVSADAQGGLKVMKPAAAIALAGQQTSSSGVLTRLGSSISDLFEGICNGISRAFSFVIRKAGEFVEFVCAIGEQVKSFVLSTLEEIGGFFKWIWSCVKTAAEKAWNFLKFLFDWDDILAVRDKLAEMIRDDLAVMKNQVSSLKGLVGPAFDRALDTIRDKGQSLGVRAADRSALAPGSGKISREQSAHSETKDKVTGSGPGAWIVEKFDNIMRNIIEFNPPPATEAEDVLARLFEEQKAVFEQLQKELGRDFKNIFGANFKITDIDLDKIQKLVLATCIRIAEAGTQSMKSIVLALIDALAGLLSMFEAILFTRIRLPFLEKLVALVSGKEVDLSFRLVDVVLLPTAILSTITYKLIFTDVPIGRVLQETLPPANVVTAQAGTLRDQLAFIKEVAGTYVGFVTVLFDAPNAALPVAVQAATTKLQWAGWAAGFLSHLFGNNPWVKGRQTPALTMGCDVVAFFIGIFQYSLRFLRLKHGPTRDVIAYQRYVMVHAFYEVVCYALQLVARVVGYLADAAADGWELVQFCGRTASQGVLQACRLIEEPTTKELMVIGACVGNLFLNLGVGLTRSAMAYTKPAPQPLMLPAT